MMREWVHCGDEASDHQLPIAVPFESPKLFLLLFQLNAKFDADSLLYLLILNAMATQYTCSFNSVYCSH